MKIYDKNIYKTQQTMRTTILIIVSFLVGFFVGYLVNLITPKTTNEITNTNSANQISYNLMSDSKVI